MTSVVEFYSPDTMPPTRGYSQIAHVKGGELLYFSGQVALNAEGELVGADYATQLEQIFRNIELGLKAACASLENLFKLNFFVSSAVPMAVLAVYQAMLPLLREAPAARIVNVSSGVGPLTMNSDPAFPYRRIFGPVYPASKTALNAMTLAMAIELEPAGIKVNAVSPGFTKTNLNHYAGTETVEEGATEAVRVALLGPDGPTGTFSHAKPGPLPW
jgi:NAD(P)-dependent dehydrogenase (short-subunit alcohol dehydrogenase family)